MITMVYEYAVTDQVRTARGWKMCFCFQVVIIEWNTKSGCIEHDHDRHRPHLLGTKPHTKDIPLQGIYWYLYPQI